MENLTGAIQAALAEARLRGEQVETVCLSVPMEPAAVEAVRAAHGLGPIARAAEGETPRWAARFWIDGHIGVTVDAGTGSMARGWARDGRETGAGGWGATLGDEGSGYWISLQAMIALLQAHDERIEKTLLTGAVLAHFGLSHVLDLVFQVSQGLVRPTQDAQPIGVVPDSGVECFPAEKPSVGGVFFRPRRSSGPLTRYEVASLCPVVVDAARQGDGQALEILRKAGYELGRLGVAIIKRLEMAQDEFVVVPFGGVFRAGELVLRSFRETILGTAPRARVVKPPFEPVVGAVLLALNEIGVAVDRRIITAVEQSSGHFPACRTMNEEARP